MPSALVASSTAVQGWFVGLMSGTSLDGVDAVLLHIGPGGAADAGGPSLQVRGHVAQPFPEPLRAELLALNTSGPDELHRAALAANALARCYASAVQALLHNCAVPAAEVQALGVHGQTVRHRPQAFDGTGYTVQLNNPALLAELTGITTVADFRTRDVAAGGQGAPLVPAFHQAVFAQPGRSLCVLNIGGMANLSVLPAEGAVLGFDCGPGNALLDHWCQQHQGQPFDRDGAWAAQGQVLPGLLQCLLDEPFLAAAPPKSTGRDLFHPAWLQERLARAGALQAAPVDVQATLAELTAEACAASARSYGKESDLLLVCGGGALNGNLMRRLAARLPGWQVQACTAYGLPPLQVEAAAFAWLAQRCLSHQPGNLARVTGAAGPRILGAIYPA